MYELFSVLFVIALVILILAIVFKRKGKQNFLVKHFRPCLISSVVVLVVSFAVVAVTMPPTEGQPQPSNIESSKPTKEKTEAEKIQEKLNITPEAWNNICIAMQGVGANPDELKESGCSVPENPDGCQYKLIWNNILFVVTMKPENVDTIENIYAGSTCLYSGDSVQNTVQNALITDDQQSIIETSTRTLIKENLISPDSASFSMTSWRFNRSENRWTVSGTVQYKNAFNAKISNDFVVIYTWDGTSNASPVPSSFTLGDQKII